jgi:hypothetical protein
MDDGSWTTMVYCSSDSKKAHDFGEGWMRVMVLD